MESILNIKTIDLKNELILFRRFKYLIVNITQASIRILAYNKKEFKDNKSVLINSFKCNVNSNHDGFFTFIINYADFYKVIEKFEEQAYLSIASVENNLHVSMMNSTAYLDIPIKRLKETEFQKTTKNLLYFLNGDIQLGIFNEMKLREHLGCVYPKKFMFGIKDKEIKLILKKNGNIKKSITTLYDTEIDGNCVVMVPNDVLRKSKNIFTFRFVASAGDVYLHIYSDRMVYYKKCKMTELKTKIKKGYKAKIELDGNKVFDMMKTLEYYDLEETDYEYSDMLMLKFIKDKLMLIAYTKIGASKEVSDNKSIKLKNKVNNDFCINIGYDDLNNILTCIKDKKFNLCNYGKKKSIIYNDKVYIKI